jgi:hypothetical protein
MNTTMDELYECMLYVHEKVTIEPWKCEVCQISEIKLPLYQNLIPKVHKSKYSHLFINTNVSYQKWEQYGLSCGHTSHPRCYRTWCFKQNAVGCPTCGPLPMIYENRNCCHCRAWGHLPIDCPIILFTRLHSMREKIIKCIDVYEVKKAF